MKYNLQDFIDTKRINILLELFHKTTGFVTAILDLEGNVLSKSGWREICTDFHRVNSETCKKCLKSDTVLAGQMAAGEKYHAYKCLNGLIDVAVPIIVNGEHIGNLFTGQFLDEEPDLDFFRLQAAEHGFDEEKYMSALKMVPVISPKDAEVAMEFLLNMTLLFCDMTMQKVEQRKSKGLYHDLVETAQDLIWQCDAEGRYTYLNPEWENVFGYKIEEMLGKTFTDFQSKEWAERDLKEFARLLKGNIVKGLETVHIGKNGEEINLKFNAKLVYDESGDILGTRGTAFNITDSKRVEAALLESEKKYTNLFSTMNEGMVLHEVIYDNKNKAIDYRIVDLNKSFESQTGIKGENAKNQLASEFYGVSPAPYLDVYLAVADSGKPTHFETYFPPLDKYFDISVFSPKKGWFATIFMDITERKNSEKAINRSEYVLNETQRISKIGGWEYEIETGETYYSDEVFNIYGLAKDNMFKAEEGIEFYHPDDRQLVSDSFTKAITEGVPYDIEVRFINAQGKNRWVRTVGKPMIENAKVVKVIGNIMDITERKTSEVALRNLSLRQEAILGAVPDIIMEVDNNKIYTWANRAGREFFGEEVIGKEAAFYFEGEQETYGAVNSVFMGIEDVVYIESWQRRRDGEKRLLAWWCRVLKDAEGNITGALSSARDITDSKKTEELLIKEKQFLEAVFNNLAEGIVSCDENGILTRFNKATKEFHGLPEEPIPADQWADHYNLYHPDGKTPMIKEDVPLFRALNEGVVKDAELTIIPKNGKAKTFVTNGQKIIDADGNSLGAVVAMHDITERKQTADALMESEERYRNLIASLEAGVVVHAADTSIKMNNHRASELLGLSSDQLKGKKAIDPQWKFIHENKTPLQLEEYPVNRVKSTKKPISNFILAVVKPNTDDLVWLTVNGLPVLDDNGEIVEILISFIEITENKRISDEILKLNEELEIRVKERTEELENAKIDLEYKNHELSRFNNLFVGRELRIKELRDKIVELEKTISKTNNP